jgi:hypothetical protein
VETSSDDDFFGFAFGIAVDGTGIPDDFYLLTWKRNTQSWSGTTAERGLKLLEVTDVASLNNDTILDLLWNGEADSHVEVLDTLLNVAWNGNTIYDVELTHEADGTIAVTMHDRTADTTVSPCTTALRIPRFGRWR